MTRKRKPTELEKQLQEAIRKSELSQYELAKQAGVTRAALSYFMNDDRSLTFESAGMIAKVLGLSLRPVRR